MINVTRLLLRLVVILTTIWLDHNIFSKLLFFNLRISLVLMFVIFLFNFDEISIEDWYLPVFFGGVINDLILPGSFIGITSFSLLSVIVIIGKLKEQGYFNFVILVLFGNITFYFLSGLSILLVSGVPLSFLFLSTVLLNITRLVILNFIFQIVVLGILNFGRKNVL